MSVSENIQSTEIKFRQLLSDFALQEQDADYGTPMVQELREVSIRSQGAIVWTNEYQTSTTSLSLKSTKAKGDKVEEPRPRAGMIKVLHFFLVDPDVKVISTRIVQPQTDKIPIHVATRHLEVLERERTEKAMLLAQDWDSQVYDPYH